MENNSIPAGTADHLILPRNSTSLPPLARGGDFGQSVEIMLRTGIPIALSLPIPNCPPGLEPLWGEKNFYFEQIQLGFLESNQNSHFSYNVYKGDGTRIYFFLNVTGTGHQVDELSSQYFTYEVIQMDAHPILTLDGDQYGGICDVCFACCVCNAHRGIRIKYNGKEIGGFEPIHKQRMPCIFSCTTCCFCYIDKYVVTYHDGSRTQQLFTRKPKISSKKKDTGLEVIDPTNGHLLAKITNCIVSGTKRKTKNLVLPSELQETPLVETEVKIRFALSLGDDYRVMHPYGKAVLLALAIFHESEVMESQRKGVKDKVGFVGA